MSTDEGAGTIRLSVRSDTTTAASRRWNFPESGELERGLAARGISVSLSSLPGQAATSRPERAFSFRTVPRRSSVDLLAAVKELLEGPAGRAMAGLTVEITVQTGGGLRTEMSIGAAYPA